MDEKLMRSLINPELLDNYNKSAGFDLRHLDTFKPACDKQELANLKDDPDVHIYEKMIPGPEGAPDIKLRIYEPTDRTANLFHAVCSSTVAAFYSEAYTDKRYVLAYVQKRKYGCCVRRIQIITYV